MKADNVTAEVEAMRFTGRAVQAAAQARSSCRQAPCNCYLCYTMHGTSGSGYAWYHRCWLDWLGWVCKLHATSIAQPVLRYAEALLHKSALKAAQPAGTPSCRPLAGHEPAAAGFSWHACVLLQHPPHAPPGNSTSGSKSSATQQRIDQQQHDPAAGHIQ